MVASFIDIKFIAINNQPIHRKHVIHINRDAELPRIHLQNLPNDLVLAKALYFH